MRLLPTLLSCYAFSCCRCYASHAAAAAAPEFIFDSFRLRAALFRHMFTPQLLCAIDIAMLAAMPFAALTLRFDGYGRYYATRYAMLLLCLRLMPRSPPCCHIRQFVVHAFTPRC